MWLVARRCGTTTSTCFSECQLHSGKAQKHSGKPSPSATLREELTAIPLMVKRRSPSAKNRALEESFLECRASTRGKI
jgi:hypothetical protein